MATPRKVHTRLKCPICKQPVAKAAADFPFCSQRCRTIDLGKWASGQYVVSSPVPDISEELSESLNQPPYRNSEDKSSDTSQEQSEDED